MCLIFNMKTEKNTPGTAGGPGGRDRTLAVKSLKPPKKSTFFQKKIKIVQGGLRAPCVLVCTMRSLAIVITIVQSLLFFFFSLRLLLFTHFGESPVCENVFPLNILA